MDVYGTRVSGGPASFCHSEKISSLLGAMVESHDWQENPTRQKGIVGWWIDRLRDRSDEFLVGHRAEFADSWVLTK